VAVAEALGCKRRRQVQRVLFGDTDVLEGESFEITASRWVALLHCERWPSISVLTAAHLSICAFCVWVGHQDGARLSVSIKTRKASVVEWLPKLWRATLSLQLMVSRSRY